MTKDRFVVVCTKSRGVFAGYCEDSSSDPITLFDAHMCVYWSAAARGVVGLAATGPTSSCRVTKAAPKMELREITAVMDVTDAAREAWQSCPWG